MPTSRSDVCLACSGPPHDGPDARCPALPATPHAAPWPERYEVEERAAILEYVHHMERRTAEALAKFQQRKL